MSINDMFQRGLGMSFRDDATRDAFFEEAKHQPERVPFGSSISHARSTNLGLMGSTEQLRHDCARIMAIEVTNFARKEGENVRKIVSTEAIENSDAFRAAFSAARKDPDARIHNVVRALGDNPYHMDRMDGSNDQAEQQLMARAPELIYEELKERGVFDARDNDILSTVTSMLRLRRDR